MCLTQIVFAALLDDDGGSASGFILKLEEICGASFPPNKWIYEGDKEQKKELLNLLNIKLQKLTSFEGESPEPEQREGM